MMFMPRASALLLALWPAGATAASTPPYPPSPVIAGVTFDWATERMFGRGSDQWPLTWAADGDLYGAWGDGNGWNNRPPKRSIGVTRVTGSPPDLRGEDRWGDGPGHGFAKPEAILAVGDTLYLFWTRGDSKSATDDTATALSRDRGKTWSYGEGKAFPQVPAGFRVRGICQFGPGYAGAPDDYVYVYFGFNHASDVFLARVPRGEIFTAARYEWFTRLRADGGAAWSRDFGAKRPAFHDPQGFMWHVGVSYVPGLKRFLLTKPHYAADDDRQAIAAKDSRMASFGLFDAPQPWGPWTTVHYTDELKDPLVKFCYYIPTKFLGDDGKTLWLAWSGWPEYDGVSFVRAKLTLRAEPPGMRGH